jgi:hypothetical protein
MDRMDSREKMSWPKCDGCDHLKMVTYSVPWTYFCKKENISIGSIHNFSNSIEPYWLGSGECHSNYDIEWIAEKK